MEIVDFFMQYVDSCRQAATLQDYHLKLMTNRVEPIAAGVEGGYTHLTVTTAPVLGCADFLEE